jgi:Cdc6-like AAA superfamily ATPase
LDWLAPPAYEAQYRDALENRQPSTGQWFLDSQEFTNWVNGDPLTLFCPGIPGAGKTVLASIAIEHLRSAHYGKESCVAFFYCKYASREDQTAKSLLATLLRQLSGQCASVPESVKEFYTSHKSKGTPPSLDEISHVLSIVISSQSRVFLIVDALDECSDETRRTVVTKIRELQKNTKASFMATSRPLEAIQREFTEDPWLEIRAEKGDVEKYLDSQLVKLSECVRENSMLKRKIQKCISEAIDGM